MKAVIEAGGTQILVEKGSRIIINRVDVPENQTIEFNKVLYIKDGDQDVFGKPYVEGVKVVGRVLRHFKGKKIIVFKYKRKKNYRRKRGHRQYLSEILIEDIVR